MEEWKTKKVRDLVGEGIIEKPLDGNHGEIHPKGNDFVSEGIPFITASDVNNGNVDLKNCKFITITQANSLRKGFAKKDDVLLTHKASLGRTAIVPKLNTEFIVLTPQVTYYRVKDKTKLNNQYLKYYFDSSGFQKKFKSFGDAGSTRAYVGISEQLNLPVVIPPIEEQKAIAKILSSLDGKIELNRQMNATLEAIAQALFKAWFVDFEPVHANTENRLSESASPEIAKLFPSKFENSVPNGWVSSTIGDTYKLTMGQSPSGDTYNENQDGMVFFQGRSDFGFRYPSPRIYCTHPMRIAEKGDTLVSVRAPVGDVNMAFERSCIGRGVASLRHNSGSRSFTYYSIKSLEGELRKFDSDGTVFGSINTNNFQAIKTIEPTLEIIKLFEKIVRPFDAQIEKNSREIVRLSEIRDSLLPRLISGKISVGDYAK